jgi:hypothetical protein
VRSRQPADGASGLLAQRRKREGICGHRSHLIKVRDQLSGRPFAAASRFFADVAYRFGLCENTGP